MFPFSFSFFVIVFCFLLWFSFVQAIHVDNAWRMRSIYNVFIVTILMWPKLKSGVQKFLIRIHACYEYYSIFLLNNKIFLKYNWPFECYWLHPNIIIFLRTLPFFSSAYTCGSSQCMHMWFFSSACIQFFLSIYIRLFPNVYKRLFLSICMWFFLKICMRLFLNTYKWFFLNVYMQSFSSAYI